MARPSVFLFSIALAASAALAGSPATQPQRESAELSPAAKLRAKNYFRPGWFLVDGNWARSQATVSSTELITLVEDDGRFHLWADPPMRFDPMLKNGRCGLIELQGSNFAWKITATGRVWNDTHSAGSQHLQMIAAMDDAKADQTFRLTKIEITPAQQVIQAAIVEGNQLVSVIVVLGQNFIECTVGPFDGAPWTLVRSTSARQLLSERPIETRRYVVPLLKLVNEGRNPLAPAAADVYRTFPDLPIDPKATATIRALVPDLAAHDPATRRRASAELQSLGRRGVQAAMRFDTGALPIEAADRIAALIKNDSRDSRSPSELRSDSGFILDCLNDPDPNVRAEAGKSVSQLTTQPAD